MSRVEPRTLALVAALAVAPLLPFLDAAFGADAPVFLAVARRILDHPLDPFGFDMVWDPVSPRVAVFNHNPPLVSYWLAPWIAWSGEREAVLHAALLPFPLLAGLAFAGIARRLCGDALRPTALLLLCPAFLVLASTLMLDVPMLAFQLVAVYALLRAFDDPRRRARWGWLAGVAAAAAGLAKYAGFATAPLLAAGALLLAGPTPPDRRGRATLLLRASIPPFVAWTALALATRSLYGHVHFAGGLALVGARDLAPDAFWNHVVSVPVWYGAALAFPIAAWLARWRPGAWGAELALAGLLLGGLATRLALPEGEPARRGEFTLWHGGLAAFASAAVVLLWGRSLWPARWRARPADRFCALWLAGQAVFSLFVNWHVTAADALLAAPPILLLWFRDPRLRPGPREAALAIAGTGALALALLAADVAQRNVYREVAPRLAREIGERPGARWVHGQWGLQYYLAREGFRPVAPLQHARHPAPLAPGDWIATARNVSQLDASEHLDRHALRGAGRWRRELALPLRVTHPDSGAGFLSHHVGYVPFALSRSPLEEIALGRVSGRHSRRFPPQTRDFTGNSGSGRLASRPPRGPVLPQVAPGRRGGPSTPSG